MIEKMEKLHIYCLRNQTSDIMEELLKAGVVQTERTQSMLPEDTARVLQPGEGLDLSREETLLADLTSSIETLKVYGSKKGLFAKRPEVSYSSLLRFAAAAFSLWSAACRMGRRPQLAAYPVFRD